MKNNNFILGIHYGHDATAVLLENGVVLEAMSEERLSRQKKHAGFPHLAIEYIKTKYSIGEFKHVCVVGEHLDQGGVIFLNKKDNQKNRDSGKRINHYIRSLGYKFELLGLLFRTRDYLFHKLKYNKKISKKVQSFLNTTFPDAHIEYIHHHDAHAWAIIPFLENHKKRLVFTLDGAGDDASGSVSLYENGKMELLNRFSLENSVGLLYSAVVDLLGMKRNEHEFKVMGLAPYAKISSGEKVYQKLKELIWFDSKDMTIRTKVHTNHATAYLIAYEYNLEHRFDSLAYGIQKLTEEITKDLVIAYTKKYNVNDIAIGGGVFMNVKANQKILELPEVNSMVSVPSCGDESLAIGSAYYLHAKIHSTKDIKKVEDIYWGSEYSDEEIKRKIDNYQFTTQHTITYFDKQSNPIEKKIAKLLSENNVVGRFSGRAEWGARALGNRSILANPSSLGNVKLINEMIKNRDFWMPFATSLRAESVDKYLKVKKKIDAPYMSITYDTKVIAYTEIIAAIHPYDRTSRPQIVTKEMNSKYYSLITEFENITGIGGVLNTSFNLHGEPNVESPFDALRTFDLSGLPHIAIGSYLISKSR